MSNIEEILKSKKLAEEVSAVLSNKVSRVSVPGKYRIYMSETSSLIVEFFNV